jgi:hypothetical protein
LVKTPKIQSDRGIESSSNLLLVFLAQLFRPKFGENTDNSDHGIDSLCKQLAARRFSSRFSARTFLRFSPKRWSKTPKKHRKYQKLTKIPKTPKSWPKTPKNTKSLPQTLKIAIFLALDSQQELVRQLSSNLEGNYIQSTDEVRKKYVTSERGDHRPIIYGLFTRNVNFVSRRLI